MLQMWLNCARSSGDRALASGARCTGSIPVGRTTKKYRSDAVFTVSLFCFAVPLPIFQFFGTFPIFALASCCIFGST